MVVRQEIRVHDQPELLLPPTPTLTQPQQALVIPDRSFLDAGQPPEQQRAPSPVEDGTFVPLPLRPSPQLPRPTGRGVHNVARVADWHHPGFPRRFMNSYDLAGRALRAARVQWVLYDEHHEDRRGFHAFYGAPDLPTTDEAWFKTVILLSADYVPARGVDFRKDGEPYTRTLRTNERMRLLNDGMIRVGNRNSVKPYVLKYVAEHGMSAVDEPLIDEFVNTPDLTRKTAIGEAMIREASRVVAEPLREEYRTAKKERFLPYERTRSVANFIGNLLTFREEPGRELDSATILSLEKYLVAA